MEVFKYISGIITHKGHKSIHVNGMSDHIHLLIGFRPAGALSDLVRDIKSNSSRFISEKLLTNGTFGWQEGYGVFSCSYRDVEKVYNYIENQEQHHKFKSFQEENPEFLKAANIDFQEQYLFEGGSGRFRTLNHGHTQSDPSKPVELNKN
jgi:REP element-mobilizing transposase RayT